MAAVQCLYQQSVTGDLKDAVQQVAALKAQLANNKNEQKLVVGMAVEPNYTMMEILLAGIHERLDEINMRLDGALNETWSRERMSPLLVSLLQCAIYELFFHKEVKPSIVIDEYTKITRKFFADGEVNFVHGALSTIVAAYG